MSLVGDVCLVGVAVLLWWLLHPINVVAATIGYTWLALFFSCLLIFVLSQTRTRLAAFTRWPWLRALGTISYCVYILHDAFNFFAHRLLLHSTPRIYDVPGIAVTLLALAATLATAAFSWRFFEKPLIRRGQSYSYSEPAS